MSVPSAKASAAIAIAQTTIAVGYEKDREWSWSGTCYFAFGATHGFEDKHVITLDALAVDGFLPAWFFHRLVARVTAWCSSVYASEQLPYPSSPPDTHVALGEKATGREEAIEREVKIEAVSDSDSGTVTVAESAPSTVFRLRSTNALDLPLYSDVVVLPLGSSCRFRLKLHEEYNCFQMDVATSSRDVNVTLPGVSNIEGRSVETEAESISMFLYRRIYRIITALNRDCETSFRFKLV